MDCKLGITEQNLRLIAAYLKINDEGRDILDIVIQKLSEICWIPQNSIKETIFTGNRQN